VTLLLTLEADDEQDIGKSKPVTEKQKSRRR